LIFDFQCPYEKSRSILFRFQEPIALAQAVYKALGENTNSKQSGRFAFTFQFKNISVATAIN